MDRSIFLQDYKYIKEHSIRINNMHLSPTRRDAVL